MTIRMDTDPALAFNPNSESDPTSQVKTDKLEVYNSIFKTFLITNVCNFMSRCHNYQYSFRTS
jgi:hypothetical protein